MTNKAVERTDGVFKFTLILKALDGILEVFGGALLFFIPPASIAHWALVLTQHELVQDPNDFFARHLLNSAQTLTVATSFFAAIYLLTHGITKVLLVIQIFRDKLWAYKGMMIFLSVSILYQLYRMSYRPSWGLGLLTLFDAFVLYLTVKEEQKIRRLTDIH